MWFLTLAKATHAVNIPDGVVHHLAVNSCHGFEHDLFVFSYDLLSELLGVYLQRLAAPSSVAGYIETNARRSVRFSLHDGPS